MHSKIASRIVSCVVLLFLLCPPLLSVASSQNSPDFLDTNVFVTDSAMVPDSTDLSINMLAMLFGKIGTVLNANLPLAVMTTLFTLFNIGILLMIAIVVFYSMIASTISLAQEGSGLSRRDGPLGVFRMVFGVSMLLPMSNGYSGIQIIVMWVVIKSINFANHLWYKAADVFVTSCSVPTAYSGVQPQASYQGAIDLTKSCYKQQIVYGDETSLTTDPYYTTQATQNLTFLSGHCRKDEAMVSMDILAALTCQAAWEFGGNPPVSLTTTAYSEAQVMPSLKNGANKDDYFVCVGDCTGGNSRLDKPICGVFRVSGSSATDAQNKANVLVSLLTTLNASTNPALPSHWFSNVTENFGSDGANDTGTDKARHQVGVNGGCSGALQSNSWAASKTFTGDDELCISTDQNASTMDNVAFPFYYKTSSQKCFNRCWLGQALDVIGEAYANAIMLNFPEGSLEKMDKLLSESSTQTSSQCLKSNDLKQGWASAGQYFFTLTGLSAYVPSSLQCSSLDYPSVVTLYAYNPICRNSNALPPGVGNPPARTLKPQYQSAFSSTLPTEIILNKNPNYMLAYAWIKAVLSTVGLTTASSSNSQQASQDVLVKPSASSSTMCKISKVMSSAQHQVLGGLPLWLTEANPATSWLGFLTGATTQTNDSANNFYSVLNKFGPLLTFGASQTVHLSWSLVNLMQSLYMVMESLTGVSMFYPSIVSRDVYKGTSDKIGDPGYWSIKGVNQQVMTSGCDFIIDRFSCGDSFYGSSSTSGSSGSDSSTKSTTLTSSGRAELASWKPQNKLWHTVWGDYVSTLNSNCGADTCAVDFLTTLAHAGCLTSIPTPKSLTNPQTQLSGLFGMQFMVDRQMNQPMNVLGNMINMGQSMMRASIFYFLVTMQQIFHSSTTFAIGMLGFALEAKVAGALAVFTIGPGTFSAFFESLINMIMSINQIVFEVVKTALELFLPLGTTISVLLFVQGVILAVYLPFLAFFYYLFGVLGWLIGVIEAMIAAPLVALGITHPEGHDFLGAAEQSAMLLLSLFIRPATMVMGLFFAIMLSQHAMGYVNEGFVSIIHEFFVLLLSSLNISSSATVPSATQSKVIILATLGLLLVYTYVCYAVLEMCFSVIYQIPDRILRWIGGQEEQTGRQAAQSADAIKQDTQGVAQQGGDAMAQATRNVPRTGTNIGKLDLSTTSSKGSGGGSGRIEGNGATPKRRGSGSSRKPSSSSSSSTSTSSSDEGGS
ncbi:MAG: DotA/TraY family protein [Pseudomonadota bacterium]|nr:DotA/TraY family protein [Pseudomonadota bacterium]